MSKEVAVFVSEDTGTALFYRFPIPMGLEAGFYEYYITDAGEDFELNSLNIRKSTLDGQPIPVFDCGMARVGALKRKDDRTYTLDKTYEQYRK